MEITQRNVTGRKPADTEVAAAVVTVVDQEEPVDAESDGGGETEPAKETTQRNVTGRKPEVTAVGCRKNTPARAPPSVDPDELIGSDKTAGLLHVKPQTLAVWRIEQRGPRYLKIGRKVFYRRADICAWLAAQLSEVA